MSSELTIDMEKRYPDIAIRAQFTQATDGYRATTLFGPSGCGKTTVLRAIAGLLRPEHGRIAWNGECWNDTDRDIFVPAQRRQVGFLFQDYALFPHMTVEQNIAYGLPRGADAQKRVRSITDRFGINGLQQRNPSELSGGQQQRVALARAAVRNPRLLLLDEPLAALDATTRRHVRNELRNLLKAGGIPAIIVTHDPTDAVSLADRVIVMHDGRILQQGATEDVFSRPANLTVADIVGVETIQRGEVLDVRDGLADIRVGTAIVHGTVHETPPRQVDICIRAEDVALFRGEIGRTSAQNALRGRISEVVAEGPLFRVVLECGFPLTALISKQARQDLNIAVGDTVTALIKATAVHIIGRADG